MLKSNIINPGANVAPYTYDIRVTGDLNGEQRKSGVTKVFIQLKKNEKKDISNNSINQNLSLNSQKLVDSSDNFEPKDSHAIELEIVDITDQKIENENSSKHTDTSNIDYVYNSTISNRQDNFQLVGGGQNYADITEENANNTSISQSIPIKNSIPNPFTNFHDSNSDFFKPESINSNKETIRKDLDKLVRHSIKYLKKRSVPQSVFRTNNNDTNSDSDSSENELEIESPELKSILQGGAGYESSVNNDSSQNISTKSSTPLILFSDRIDGLLKQYFDEDELRDYLRALNQKHRFISCEKTELQDVLSKTALPNESFDNIPKTPQMSLKDACYHPMPYSDPEHELSDVLSRTSWGDTKPTNTSNNNYSFSPIPSPSPYYPPPTNTISNSNNLSENLFGAGTNSPNSPVHGKSQNTPSISLNRPASEFNISNSQLVLSKNPSTISHPQQFSEPPKAKQKNHGFTMNPNFNWEVPSDMLAEPIKIQSQFKILSESPKPVHMSDIDELQKNLKPLYMNSIKSHLSQSSFSYGENQSSIQESETSNNPLKSRFQHSLFNNINTDDTNNNSSVSSLSGGAYKSVDIQTYSNNDKRVNKQRSSPSLFNYYNKQSNFPNSPLPMSNSPLLNRSSPIHFQQQSRTSSSASSRPLPQIPTKSRNQSRASIPSLDHTSAYNIDLLPTPPMSNLDIQQSSDRYLSQSHTSSISSSKTDPHTYKKSFSPKPLKHMKSFPSEIINVLERTGGIPSSFNNNSNIHIPATSPHPSNNHSSSIQKSHTPTPQIDLSSPSPLPLPTKINSPYLNSPSRASSDYEIKEIQQRTQNIVISQPNLSSYIHSQNISNPQISKKPSYSSLYESIPKEDNQSFDHNISNSNPRDNGLTSQNNNNYSVDHSNNPSSSSPAQVYENSDVEMPKPPTPVFGKFPSPPPGADAKNSRKKESNNNSGPNNDSRLNDNSAINNNSRLNNNPEPKSIQSSLRSDYRDSTSTLMDAFRKGKLNLPKEDELSDSFANNNSQFPPNLVPVNGSESILIPELSGGGYKYTEKIPRPSSIAPSESVSSAPYRNEMLSAYFRKYIDSNPAIKAKNSAPVYCSACSKLLPSSNHDLGIHTECIRCETCNAFIGNSEYKCVDNHFFCVNHFDRYFPKDELDERSRTPVDSGNGIRSADPSYNSEPQNKSNETIRGGASEKKPIATSGWRFGQQNTSFFPSQSFANINDFVDYMHKKKNNVEKADLEMKKYFELSGNVDNKKDKVIEQKRIITPMGSEWLNERETRKEFKTQVLEKRTLISSPLSNSSNRDQTRDSENFGSSNSYVPSETNYSVPKNKYIMVNGYSQCICPTCDKIIYPTDKISFERYDYHKLCLKCIECGRSLSHQSAVRVDSSVYCLNHAAPLLRRASKLLSRKRSKSASTFSRLSTPNSPNNMNFNHLSPTGNNQYRSKPLPLRPIPSPALSVVSSNIQRFDPRFQAHLKNGNTPKGGNKSRASYLNPRGPSIADNFHLIPEGDRHYLNSNQAIAIDGQMSLTSMFNPFNDEPNTSPNNNRAPASPRNNNYEPNNQNFKPPFANKPNISSPLSKYQN
ncbi:hypothetical protein AYI70_g4640 [Smittium culicis]|uniref:LIM zinc-binding domain-containing protein n=1 Tax=Smittium culicis TaxID=133412 RepID=A0A1R1XYJ6_9FUNG|nr:hypothetical protein AYI70_g4640 [Smittium culicis]